MQINATYYLLTYFLGCLKVSLNSWAYWWVSVLCSTVDGVCGASSWGGVESGRNCLSQSLCWVFLGRWRFPGIHPLCTLEHLCSCLLYPDRLVACVLVCLFSFIVSIVWNFSFRHSEYYYYCFYLICKIQCNYTSGFNSLGLIKLRMVFVLGWLAFIDFLLAW